MADFYSKENARHLQKLRESNPRLYRAFHEFSQEVFKDDALPGKTKQLIAVAVAHTTQCPWCISGHTKAAKRAGASDQEIAEAIYVAMEMRAGASYTHGGIAMASLEDLEH